MYGILYELLYIIQYVHKYICTTTYIFTHYIFEICVDHLALMHLFALLYGIPLHNLIYSLSY